MISVFQGLLSFQGVIWTHMSFQNSTTLCQSKQSRLDLGVSGSFTNLSQENIDTGPSD